MADRTDRQLEEPFDEGYGDTEWASLSPAERAYKDQQRNAMAENSSSPARRETEDYTKEVAGFTDATGELEPISERYARGRLSEEIQWNILETLATFDPALRANIYAAYVMTAIADPEVMTDTEIFVLSFAYQDHMASQAVEQGLVQAVEEGQPQPMGGTYDPDWYLDNVSYRGDTVDARNGLRELFQAGAAAPKQRDGWGEKVAGWFEDPLGTMEETKQNPDEVMEAINAGLAFQRDDFGSTDSSPGLATGGDRGYNNFWNGIDILSQVAGVAALAVGVGSTAAWATPNPVRAGGSLTRSSLNVAGYTGRSIQSSILGEPAQYRDLTKYNLFEGLTYASSRAARPVESIMNMAATRTPGLVRGGAATADWLMGSRLTSKPLMAASFIFGNMALSAAMNAWDPAMVEQAEADVRQEESDKDWDQAYDNAITAGLTENEARLKANDEAPAGRSPVIRKEQGGDEIAPQALSYEERKDIFDRNVEKANEVVKVSRVRTQRLNQVATTNTNAWQREYDRLIDEGLTAKQAEKEANKAVPPPTTEQNEDIIDGLSQGEDVPGVESEHDQTVASYFDKMGYRYLGPDEDISDVAEGESLMPDPSDPDGFRQIVVPANGLSANEMEDLFGVLGYGGREEEWEPYISPFYAAEQADPYIRTPYDYRTEATEGDQSAFTRRYGGTLMDQTDGVVRPDYMDQTEIDFINKAQPGSIDLPGAIAPTYRESDVLDMISGMSTVQIFRFQDLAQKAGFYGSKERPTIAGSMSMQDQSILGTVMGQANVDGKTVWPMLDLFAAAEQAAPGPAGPVKQPFSVPAHLRSIPGDKTVAEEAKARFRQKMGRDARPDELAGIANDLTGYHTTSNQEEIALYLAAYNGDNQGLLTGAQMQKIEEPGAATSFDISDKWANEIDLNKRRETNSESFKRMLAATMGNRPSVGNLTAAGGVQTIGRQ